MSYTISYTAVRIGETTEVTVATSMSGVVWYCWYLDGAFVGKTTGPTKTFQLSEGEQLRLEVIPTADADFDPIANAPEGFPSRRTLFWTRSLSADVASYRVEQKKGAGGWSTIATITRTQAWSYSVTTGRLNDLTQYTWRIVPVDSAGNDGTAIVVGPEMIVRTPDAPDFSIAFDGEDQAVTFSETEN